MACYAHPVCGCRPLVTALRGVRTKKTETAPNVGIGAEPLTGEECPPDGKSSNSNGQQRRPRLTAGPSSSHGAGGSPRLAHYRGPRQDRRTTTERGRELMGKPVPIIVSGVTLDLTTPEGRTAAAERKAAVIRLRNF